MGGKLRDIALIYAAYDARLRSGDFGSRSRLQSGAPGGKRLSPGLQRVSGRFFILQPPGESILELVLRQAESVTVTLLGDGAATGCSRTPCASGCAWSAWPGRGRRRTCCGAKAGGQGPPGAPGSPLFRPGGPLRRGTGGPGPVPGGHGLYRGGMGVPAAAAAGGGGLSLAGHGRVRPEYGGLRPLLESVFRRDGIPAYISRRSDLLEKAPITMLLGHWTPSPAASTGRTCSAA